MKEEEVELEELTGRKKNEEVLVLCFYLFLCDV